MIPHCMESVKISYHMQLVRFAHSKCEDWNVNWIKVELFPVDILGTHDYWNIWHKRENCANFSKYLTVSVDYKQFLLYCRLKVLFRTFLLYKSDPRKSNKSNLIINIQNIVNFDLMGSSQSSPRNYVHSRSHWWNIRDERPHSSKHLSTEIWGGWSNPHISYTPFLCSDRQSNNVDCR